MELTASALADVVQEIDFTKQSPVHVQAAAEKAVTAVVKFSKTNEPSVDLARIRKLL